MIKANELRKGNLIRWSGHIVSVNTGSEIDLMHAMAFPIDLTPEWLERLGFEKQDDGSCNIQIGSTIYLEFSRDMVCSVTPGIWFDYVCRTKSEIKYLHQLQNLYFGLTGEEITINDVNL